MLSQSAHRFGCLSSGYSGRGPGWEHRGCEWELIEKVRYDAR
jgi:hypothetical protein